MKRIIPILGLVCTVFFSCTMNEMVFDDLNDQWTRKANYKDICNK